METVIENLGNSELCRSRLIRPSVTLRNPELWTISLKLVSFSSQWASLQQYGPMFAGYVIASIPLLILFMFTMRLFIEGLASGAIKA